MYNLQIPLALLGLLGGFATLYTGIFFLRHQRFPRLAQFGLAMLLGACLAGLSGAAAGLYLLFMMNAATPLTLAIVILPALVLGTLAVLALTYMRAPKTPLIRT